MGLAGKLVASSLWVCLAFCAGFAQGRPIDINASKIRIRVYKSGLFSAFAHDHTIVAPVASGHLDTTARTVELVFRSSELKVLDPGVSEKDRIQIDRDMKSVKVLDVDHYPEIRFVSRSITASDASHFVVRGELTLHGNTKPLELPVSFSAGRYAGETKLKQTDFGITPIKIAGGAVRVKDVIDVSFEIIPAAP